MVRCTEFWSVRIDHTLNKNETSEMFVSTKLDTNSVNEVSSLNKGPHYNISIINADDLDANPVEIAIIFINNPRLTEARFRKRICSRKMCLSR